MHSMFRPAKALGSLVASSVVTACVGPSNRRFNNHLSSGIRDFRDSSFDIYCSEIAGSIAHLHSQARHALLR